MSGYTMQQKTTSCGGNYPAPAASFCAFMPSCPFLDIALLAVSVFVIIAVRITLPAVLLLGLCHLVVRLRRQISLKEQLTPVPSFR